MVSISINIKCSFSLSRKLTHRVSLLCANFIDLHSQTSLRVAHICAAHLNRAKLLSIHLSAKSARRVCRCKPVVHCIRIECISGIQCLQGASLRLHSRLIVKFEQGEAKLFERWLIFVYLRQINPWAHQVHCRFQLVPDPEDSPFCGIESGVLVKIL